MRSSLRITLGAAILPAALIVSACGTSPLEPTAAATAAAQPKNLSGFVVSWGGKKVETPAVAQPQQLSGFVVSWGSKEAPAAQPQQLSGFVVSWGKDQHQAQPQQLSGFVVSWGKDGAK